MEQGTCVEAGVEAGGEVGAGVGEGRHNCPAPRPAPGTAAVQAPVAAGARVWNIFAWLEYFSRSVSRIFTIQGHGRRIAGHSFILIAYEKYFQKDKNSGHLIWKILYCVL